MNLGTETLKKLQVVLTGNTQQLQTAMKQAQDATKTATNSIQGGLDKVGDKFKALGKIAASAVSVKAVVSFGKQCVELGSALSEVQNVVDVTFGSMSKQVDDFAKSAIDKFGLSETAAKKYTSTMGAMLKSMGLTTEQAYKMSTNLTGLSADMASFYNLDSEDAFSKLRSGIAGETEPLKQLGINMSVANLEAFALSKGLTKSYESMSQAEQAALRYNYILNATKDVQGDFARTSDSWANQTRILQMRFDSIKASLGQGLIAALTPVVRVINELLGKLAELAERFRAVMAQITGTTLNESSDAVADNLTEASEAAASTGKNLTDGVKDAEKAAKRFLMTFDEIHKVSGDETGIDTETLDSLLNSGTANEMNDIAEGTANENDQLSEMGGVLDTIKEKIQPVIDKITTMGTAFKDGFEEGLGDQVEERAQDIMDNCAGIGDAIGEIFTDPKVTTAADEFTNQLSETAGEVAGSATSIGITLGQNVTGGLDKALNNNKGRISNWMSTMFGKGTSLSKKAGELSKSIAKIFEPLGSEEAQSATGHALSGTGNLMMGVTELAAKTYDDVTSIWSQPIVMNTDKIQESMTNIVAFADDITATYDEAAQHISDTMNETYDQHISPLYQSMADGATDTWGQILDAFNTTIKPMLDQWGEDVATLWNEHLKPTWDKLMEVVGKIGDALKLLWENILQPIFTWLSTTFVNTILPIINDIWNAVSGAIGGILDFLGGLLESLGGLIDFVVGIFTGDWEKAWNGIQQIFEGFWHAIEGIINTVKDIILGAVNAVVDFFAGIGQGIANGFNAVVDWGKGLLGIQDEPQVPDTPVQYEDISGKAANVIESNSLTEDDVYSAMKTALEETGGEDIIMEIDGEQLAVATDKAGSYRNTRINPRVSYGYSGG